VTGTPRRRVWLWLLFMLPSLAVSAWLFLWLEWMLPTEDGKVEGPLILTLSLIAGMTLGTGRTAARSMAARWWLRAAVAAGLSPLTILLQSMVGFTSLAAVSSIGPWLAVFAVPALVGYLVCRIVTRYLAGQWQAPAAVALLPLLLVMSISCATGNVKRCWPWSSWRPALLALESNAVAAADRLHLPRDRPLTREEQDRWRREAPLRLTLRFPVTHWEVVASVVNPWSDQLVGDGRLWLWWGDKTFGPFDPKKMTILSASD
jgi:hypothetical protein